MVRLVKDDIVEALARRARRVVADPGLTKAAVLMPLYEEGDELRILLTRRSEELPRHKGQIAFPGGGQRLGDADLRATALRETEEEVGIHPADVQIVGALDDAVTLTSQYVVAPFVGFIPYPYPFRVNPAEIVELIPLPLSTLCDRSCFREELWDRGGTKAPVYFYTVDSHVIWGLTARILKQFFEAVLPAQPAIW
jgi:8-oxo-dGTP pyrophosphatase MutT (NUDIX family)